MKNSTSSAQELQQPRPDAGHAGTPHPARPQSPLDALGYCSYTNHAHIGVAVHQPQEPLSPADPGQPQERQSPPEPEPGPQALIIRALDAALPAQADALRECRRAPRYRPCLRWKFCVPCGQDRARRLQANHARRIARMANPWLLTLTTRGERVLTRRYLAWLRNRLQRFLRWSSFRHAVIGGLYAIEVKVGPSGLWCAHVHLIIDMRGTLSRSQVATAWCRRTGSYIVDLRQVQVSIVDQVVAYQAKPPQLTRRASVTQAREEIESLIAPPDLPLDGWRLKQFQTATHNFRFVQPFGSWSPGYKHVPVNRRDQADGGAR